MRRAIRGRLLAGILAAGMLFTAVPWTVHAVEGAEETALTTQGQTQDNAETEQGRSEMEDGDLKDGGNPAEGETPEVDMTPGDGEKPKEDMDSEHDRTSGEGDNTSESGDAETGEDMQGDGDDSKEGDLPAEDEIMDGDNRPVDENILEEGVDSETDLEEDSVFDENGVSEDYREITTFGISSHTQQEAVDWARGQVGKITGQCVRLIKDYYAYLGENLGSIGEAKNIINVTPPSGWELISKDAGGFAIQSGDVAVWTSGAYSQYGHVGVVVATYAGGFDSAELNYKKNPSTGVYDGSVLCAIVPHSNMNGFWGVIRPKFRSSAPQEHGGYWEEGYYQVIPNGDYHIVSALGDQWWLTNAGFSMENGGNVQLWEYNDLQCADHVYNFRFIPDGKGNGRGFYIITNKQSGKCLASEGANAWLYNQSTWERTNVQQWIYSGSGQEWAVNEIDGGEKGMFYTFQARCSGYYIDVEDGLAASGTNISMWKGNGEAAQQWRLIPYVPSIGRTIEDGEYQITSIFSEDKVISVAEEEPENGTNVELNARKGDHRHTFDVKYEDDGYYSIINRHSGLSLDVEGGPNARKLRLNIQLWERDRNSGAQKWVIQPCRNGYYNVISVCNGMYFDLQGGGAEDGNNIDLWEGAADNQYLKWKFIPYGKPGEKPDKPDIPDKPDVPEIPDTPDRGDVLEKDIPQGKVENIPEGLWMSAVPSQVYTGKAIKPEVRVYDYKTLLTEKKDYTISYQNNTKANAASGAGSPSITVTGKGNYTGKETQTFVIRSKSLLDVDVVADGMTVQYNGKTQKPVPVVTWNGRKLSKNRDYTVTYPDEERDGAANPGAYTKAGDYKIRICGVGNYAGERDVSLTITRNRPASVMKVSKIANQIYTGDEVRPALTVKDGKAVLKEGEDYEVSYQNNISVGQASAVIAGKGNYAGAKRVSFQIIHRASMKQAKAELEFAGLAVYTGGEVKPVGYRLTVSVKHVGADTVTETLEEGRDFTVAYKNNIKPGTATILFEGMNGYTGTLKKTYKIKTYNIAESGAGIAENDGKIRIELADSYTYTKGGCKPEPVVTFQGTELKKGTDYTLSYKNNTALNGGSNPGKLPSVRVKGKGCFSGVREMNFKIVPKDIGGLTMTAADKVWQNKKNIYRTKVIIRDTDGKALSAGKDYEKLLRYSYGADTVLSDGTLRKEGEEVLDSDILPAGTVVCVTANAKGSNYTGALSCSYRITKADIGKAKVTVPAQTYTGREIRPDEEIRVKLGGKILSEDNYEIAGYANNINKGTATVTIKGRNDCGGVKTVKFRIKGKGFLWWWR